VIYSVAAWCEECGFRNVIERLSPAGATIYLICHECEAPLTVKVATAETVQRVSVRG
jgi:hypothetical protein